MQMEIAIVGLPVWRARRTRSWQGLQTRPAVKAMRTVRCTDGFMEIPSRSLCKKMQALNHPERREPADR